MVFDRGHQASPCLSYDVKWVCPFIVDGGGKGPRTSISVYRDGRRHYFNRFVACA